MRVVNATGTGVDVGSALDIALKEINKQLSQVPGIITHSYVDISFGVASATVTLTLAVNGSEPRKKEVLGVNVRGITKEQSIKKATDKLNSMLVKKKGEIAFVYNKTVDTHLPGRVYTTLIVGVNESEIRDIKGDVKDRRERLRASLELLNNDPNALNIARVAEIFGVSRTVIYKDLEILGFKRFGK